MKLKIIIFITAFNFMTDATSIILLFDSSLLVGPFYLVVSPTFNFYLATVNL